MACAAEVGDVMEGPRVCWASPASHELGRTVVLQVPMTNEQAEEAFNGLLGNISSWILLAQQTLGPSITSPIIEGKDPVKQTVIEARVCKRCGQVIVSEEDR
jgi:hypothetical protein